MFCFQFEIIGSVKGSRWRTPKLLDGLIYETKGEDIGRRRSWARSLIRSTSGVQGHAGVLGWGLGRLTSESITHTTCTNQTTSWLVHTWNIFGAWTKHGKIWTHKTHQSLNLGETTTFPLIVFFVPGHGASTQMSFSPKTLKWESRNSQNWNSYNFGSP